VTAYLLHPPLVVNYSAWLLQPGFFLPVTQTLHGTMKPFLLIG
jgi:hypothetical protein